MGKNTPEKPGIEPNPSPIAPLPSPTEGGKPIEVAQATVDQQARQNLGEGVGENLGKGIAKAKTDKKEIQEKPTKAADEDLPDNPWTRAYFSLKKHLENDPSSRGPMSEMALQIMLMMAKTDKYLDLIPSKFSRKLEEDENLKAKKLTAEEVEKVKAMKKEAEEQLRLAKEAEEKMKGLVESEKAAGREIGIEKASTKYACCRLWQIEGIEDATTLGAKLVHTKVVDKISFERLKNEDLLYGTIVIFVMDAKSAEKVVGFATGKGDEIEYFHPQYGVQRFNLKDKVAPWMPDFIFLTALKPTI